YALAWLGRFMSLDAAVRVVFSVYVVGLMLAFRDLVTAVHPARGAGWTTVLGSLLVWNPVVCMGFLEFALAIPVVLLGAAFALRCARPSVSGLARVGLVASAVALASIHVVAAGCLALFALLHVALNPGPRGVATAVTVFGGIGSACGVWS